MPHKVGTFETILKIMLGEINNVLDDVDPPGDNEHHVLQLAPLSTQERIDASIKRSIQNNEWAIRDTLEVWVNFLSEEKTRPWLDYYFSRHPQKFVNLFKALYNLKRFRTDTNLAINCHFRDPSVADSDSGLTAKAEQLNVLESELDNLEASLASLSKKYSGNLVSGLKHVLKRMDEHAEDIYAKQKKSWLAWHIVFQAFCILLLIATTGLMIFFYMAHMQMFKDYFIACSSVALTSIVALSVDFVVAYRERRSVDLMLSTKDFIEVRDADDASDLDTVEIDLGIVAGRRTTTV